MSATIPNHLKGEGRVGGGGLGWTIRDTVQYRMGHIDFWGWVSMEEDEGEREDSSM